ncbi:MAG: hypothetical protein WED04_02555 [Promethearchaeati archaeon SRVP18_Atabeyarchaeia-1]
MEEKDGLGRAPNASPTRRVHIADIFATENSEPAPSKNERLANVKIYGIVMDKRVFRSEGKVDYGVISIDDGSGFLIQIKTWSGETSAVEKMAVGDMIDVVGKVKKKNADVYVIPSIVRKIEDPNWETVRELEIMKDSLVESKARLTRSAPPTPHSKSIESEILEIIEGGSNSVGVEYKELIKRIEHSSEEEIKKTLKELLDQGKIYESRPNRYRK